jgi:hypothetical protein
VVAFDYYEQGPILAADGPYSANPDHSVLWPAYPSLPFLESTVGFDVTGSAPLTVPVNSPWNKTGEAVQIAFPGGMYLPEMGAWNSDVIIRTIRNVVGATLKLPHDWVINASFLYGESDGTQYVYNGTNKQRLSLALAGQLPGHVGQFFNPFIDERYAGNFNQQFYNALRTIQWEDVRTSVLT